MNQPLSVNLFYTEGSSDKVYQVQLVEADGGWKVRAQNGRRGGTLRPQEKTPEPVEYTKARKIYDTLVASKKRDGYTEDESGSVYQDTVKAEHFTGIVAQLLNPVDEDDGQVQQLLDDDHWVVQEKHDGERRMIQRAGKMVWGINREGMRVPLPVCVADYFGQLAGGDFIVDGEIMGERYVAFDLLEVDGRDLRSQAYHQRLEALEGLVDGNALIQAVHTCHEPAAKQALAAQVRKDNGEGVVFKDKHAPWSAGRPASGGVARKWKFTESATVVAGPATTGKRSIQVLALDGDGELAHVGKVSIPPNHAVPAPGTLVEVGYLYRMPGDGGCLFQPVYKGLRADKTGADTIASMKVKREVVAPQRRKPAP